MDENEKDDVTEPVPGPAPEPAPGPSSRRGFRERLRTARNGQDRAFGVAALVASTLAALLIGGLGGVLIGQETGDRDWGRGELMSRNGQQMGPGGMMGPRGMMGPGGMMGERGPGTMDPDDCPFLQQDDSDSDPGTSPSPSSSSS